MNIVKGNINQLEDDDSVAYVLHDDIHAKFARWKSGFGVEMGKMIKILLRCRKESTLIESYNRVKALLTLFIYV